MHCVPDEGWSPAEPEHWREAPRHCCGYLLRIVRRASPAVAKRVSARVAVTDRGTERARKHVACRASGFTHRCEAVVEPRRVPSADDHVDDSARGDDHDDRSTDRDHDDDGTAGDDHDDQAPPPPPPPAPTTTTTTAPPPRPAAAHSEGGEATWYSAAPAGYCASPTLPFGTVLTVVNNATGASTECTVDDREAAGYPRVVDMSPSGFSQIGDISQGVVDVTISW